MNFPKFRWIAEFAPVDEDFCNSEDMGYAYVDQRSA